jgi:hypothetical protein
MAHSPLGKRRNEFWYIVIWKDLETVLTAFDRLQDNVSILKHAFPDCKRETCLKNVLVLLVSGVADARSTTRKVPRGHNTNKTLHSRCQSASPVMRLHHEKFRKMVKLDSSSIHNSQIIFGRWWRQTGSNRRPEACKATALPTELCPQLASSQASGLCPTSHTIWWAWEDLNFRPHAYQARALTN